MFDIVFKAEIKNLLIAELLIKHPIELKYFLPLIEPVSLLCYSYLIVVDIHNLFWVFSLLEVLP